jgi:NAD(P)-dependent dehydrogenase (short-subunit alcohol dehydrogenase family)
MRERETTSNLATMRAAGSTVEYIAVDVAKDAEFSAVINRVYQRHGRIDGVIHGAGVIEDKLIRDKTLDSFQRVCDPKIRGAMTLANRLRPESLKFLAFFSSVSGRYGNRGQADYAAANEVLDKLALYLNARWKARVTAMIWGPWESTGGMVSAELAKQFAKAGIHIISRREGKKAVIDEIVLGRKDEAEVVFGGPLDVSLPATGSAASPSAIEATSDTPLLKLNAKVSRRADGGIEVMRSVDPTSDIYLSDHQLDGRPVMPMAMMQELFAEAATLVRSGWSVTRVRDLRVLRGISFEKGPRTIRVTTTAAADEGAVARIKVQAEVGEQGQIHDTAEVEISSQKLPTPKHQPLKLMNPRPLPLTVADAYEQWLFHGPIFAGIVEVEAVGENGVIAQIAPSTPRRCLVGSPAGDWLIDPVMVDSALQLIILWARVYLDMTPLPARLAAYHRYEGPIREPVRCEATVRHVAGTPIIHADFRFIDARGVLVGWLEGLEGTCSKALNRLAETRSGQVIEQK